MLLPEHYALLTLAVSAGAAFGGVKIGLNGTRERTIKVERTLDEHVAQTQRNSQKTQEVLSTLTTEVARTSTKVDMLLQHGDKFTHL